MTDHSAIALHYERPGLLEAILKALDSAGKSPPYTLNDLAAVDQFHMGGRSATEGLAHLARIDATTRVLDVGGGIGGPARTLAHEIGCPVTLLDITVEFCRTAEALNRLTGLEHLVTVRQGDALAMPFEPRSFDCAWTQHSTMNIADKRALYREIHRVVRPGGTLAMHEVTAGMRGRIFMPVPWASLHGLSHLESPHELREAIEEAGFRVREWEDVTPAALFWWQSRKVDSRNPAPPPPVGIHLILGPAAGEMGANTLRNIEEDRIRVVRGVFTRL